MATVKFSSELRKIIINNARRSLDPRFEKVEKIKNNITRSYGDKIYDKIFQEYAGYIRNIRDGWSKTVDHIKINAVRDINFNADFMLSSQRFWPYDIRQLTIKSEYIGWGSNVFYDERLALRDYPLFPVWEDLYQDICDYRRKEAAVRQEINDFGNDVTTIINSYNTLAPALKAWPPLWDLLPEETKEKHKQISAKRVSSSVDLNVNLDKLTAIATATKLGV